MECWDYSTNDVAPMARLNNLSEVVARPFARSLVTA